MHPTIEDIYTAMIETDRGVKEKVRIFDTGGLVSFDICRKVPKFSDARNFAVIHLKFKQRGQT